jgi:large subunit ribosomal protein L4
MSETQTQTIAAGAHQTAATGADREVDVLDASGATTGTAVLPGALFDVTANIPLIHQVVVAQLAAARQGTSKVKTRAEVSGGGRKPHRQKGTGRARQGSIRAPQYVGGGIVHGPSPRSYVQRTPKKMIAAALRGALSDRARENRVHVVSDLVGSDQPSTKAVLRALSASTSSAKVLVVLGRDEDVTWVSLRNVPTAHAIAVDQLNAYDVLVNDEVVFTSVALEAFIAGPTAGRSAKAVASSAEPDAFVEPTNEELAAEADGADELAAEADGAEDLSASEVDLVPADAATDDTLATETEEETK